MEVRIELPSSDMSVATNIATGFVSTYLDTAGIYTAYSALQASFSAFSTYSDVAELSTGYDGTMSGLIGPSPVKLFRITATPDLFSRLLV